MLLCIDQSFITGNAKSAGSRVPLNGFRSINLQLHISGSLARRSRPLTVLTGESARASLQEWCHSASFYTDTCNCNTHQTRVGIQSHRISRQLQSSQLVRGKMSRNGATQRTSVEETASCSGSLTRQPQSTHMKCPSSNALIAAGIVPTSKTQQESCTSRSMHR